MNEKQCNKSIISNLQLLALRVRHVQRGVSDDYMLRQVQRYYNITCYMTASLTCRHSPLRSDSRLHNRAVSVSMNHSEPPAARRRLLYNTSCNICAWNVHRTFHRIRAWTQHEDRYKRKLFQDHASVFSPSLRKSSTSLLIICFQADLGFSSFL